MHSKGHRHGGTSGHVIHWASAYHALFGWFLRRTHPAVVALAAPTAGEGVLDVCCGTGTLTLALRRELGSEGSVRGVDASPEMVAVARSNAARSGLDVEFREGLAEELPFPDSSFDLVVSQLAIHHLPGELKQQAFSEMRRVLKPGGRCLIVDFEPPRTGFAAVLAKGLLGSEMAHTDVRDYCSLMEEAGFAALESGPTGHRLLAYVKARAIG